MKAQQIVDAITAYANVQDPPLQTCDGYKFGGPDTEVTGVVTTFMATVEVLRAARARGANMVITHEPTYFTGLDATDWLQQDPVYLEKQQLLQQGNFVVWRYHDRMHMMQPDAIYEGLLAELGWQQYRQPATPPTAIGPGGPVNFEELFNDFYVLPRTKLCDLAAFLKQKLQMNAVQVIGDGQMECTRVGVLVGGGSLGFGDEAMPMKVMRAKDLDVMVCGEITEWTLCAYVNDASQLGKRRALIIIGHERTEEWGMKHMATWLAPLVPGVPVSFLDAKEPFWYV